MSHQVWIRRYPFKVYNWTKWKDPFDDRSDALKEIDKVRLEENCIAVACYGNETPKDYIKQQIQDRKESLAHLQRA